MTENTDRIQLAALRVTDMERHINELFAILTAVARSKGYPVPTEFAAEASDLVTKLLEEKCLAIQISAPATVVDPAIPED